MTINKEIEFNNIVGDILKNEEFIKLKYEIHHGISRLDHSLNVAKLTYLFCCKFHLKKTNKATRAALLHDFFLSQEVPGIKFINHPSVAVSNSLKYFAIDSFQENIIASHMFPMSKTIPKYKESWLISFCDKLAAIKEGTLYKAPLTVGSVFLFILDFCFIRR